MKIKIITILLVAFILVSCASIVKVVPTETAVPMSTFTPVPPTIAPTSSPTPFINSYPPCASPFESSLSSPTLELKLSNSLILKEYQDGYNLQGSGCRYANRNRADVKEIFLDNSYQVVTKPIGNKKEKVDVFRNDKKVFETEISSFIYSGLLEAWGYDNHWAIEFVTADTAIKNGGVRPMSSMIDIVRDGVSLKKKNNYKEVFAFQLLDGEPLYFFKTHDNVFGVNYDSNAILLDYDDIPYDNPHPGYDLSIFHFQNMVLFLAEKNDSWRPVTISLFNKK